jgi:hypothetical protein
MVSELKVKLNLLLGSFGWHPRRIVSKLEKLCWKNPSKTEWSRQSQLGRRNQEPERTKMSPKVKRNKGVRSYSPRNNMKSSSR